MQFGSFAQSFYDDGIGEDPHIPPTEPGEPEQPAPSGWPSPVPPSSEHWVKQQGVWRYIVHPGVTLSGLAATYLLLPNRWKEIWDVQRSAVKQQATPDHIPVGVALDMPAEAVERAREWGLLRAPGAAPVPPGADPSHPIHVEDDKATKTAVVIGAAAVLGGLLMMGASK